MNNGLLTFPKSDQLLRGGDLLKLNQHLNGFPLPASHPKIVSGLHVFPKQDVEYGVYFAANQTAIVNNIYRTGPPWELLDKDFTIEFCAKLIKIQAHGFVGNGHSSFNYNGTYADGWGFCNYNNNTVQYFKIQDVSLSLVYSFNLIIESDYHTHTIVRSNNNSCIDYFYDGAWKYKININTELNIQGYGTAGFAGFNTGLNRGFSHVLKYMRFSNIARDNAWISQNFNNKYALDANVTGLYNCYNETGIGSKIMNIAKNPIEAVFGTGSTAPIWVTL